MEQNGEIRTKRKLPPLSALDRPVKQMKSETSESAMSQGSSGTSGNFGASRNIESSPGENRARLGSLTLHSSTESDGDAGRLLPLPSGAPDTPEWQATIERVIRNVVSIQFCQTCSFDTTPACSSEATGFVVDAEQGYILTNRHVVCAGPFWGHCIFDNHEEVDIIPLDPLHGFM